MKIVLQKKTGLYMNDWIDVKFRNEIRNIVAFNYYYMVEQIHRDRSLGAYVNQRVGPIVRSSINNKNVGYDLNS